MEPDADRPRVPGLGATPGGVAREHLPRRAMRSRTVEGMFANWRRKRAVAKVKPGDGHALPRYRWWQPLTRTLFHLPLTAEDGTQQTWSVDVRLWGDDDGVVQEPIDQPYGIRDCAFRDPAGNMIRLQQLA